MGKLESIERYGNAYGWPEEFPWVREMAEAVEREVEGRFAELPVDAEGVPIRVGDRMEYVQPDDDDKPFEVIALGCRDNGFEIYYDVEGRPFPRSVTMAGSIRHVKQTPTVEDALVRFLADWEGVPASEINAANPKIAAHAERVREAARAE